MRLVKLHLDRYGPFTDRVLTLRPGAKLHLVYGPNEAGKSSALAAITDLLFGITPKTGYAFLHDGPDLRLGAEIVSRAGGAFTFRRRKGNKNTLLDATDAHLSDDALTPFLGGLTREVFCRAFGLDADGLRDGANAMMRSGGEVGESLFAAASGLRNLADLRRELDSEAGTIFAPRASKDRVFYQALGRHDDAKRAIRAGELRSGDWRDLNERIETQSVHLEALRQRRAALAGEQARLRRAKRIAPLLGAIDRLSDELESFADLPALPEAALDQLAGLLADAGLSGEARSAAERDLRQAATDLEGACLDETILKHAPTILALFSQVSAYARNRRDLPRIDIEADEFRAALAALAVRIGLPDGRAVEREQPSEAAKARVEALVGEGRELRNAADRLAGELSEARERHAALTRQRAERGHLVDPTPLRQALQALDPVLREMHRCDDLARQIHKEERAIGNAAARLNPPISNVEMLAAASIPAAETIARFRSQGDSLARDIERATDRVAAATSAAGDIAARLKQRSDHGDVPSVSSLRTARSDRDAAWQRLRATLFGAPDAPPGPALADGVVRFERALGEADRLADAMATDAQRAADHAADLHRLDDERAKQAEAEAVLADLGQRRAELDASWADLWTRTGLLPLPPAEMAAWLVQADLLIERWTALEAKRTDRHVLGERLESIRPALLGLAQRAGLAGLDLLDVGLIAAQIETRLDALARDWDAARDTETRLRTIEEQVAQLSARHSRAGEALSAWSTRWSASLVGIGLDRNAGLDEAEAALAAWREVPATIRERDNREKRVAGMQRDVDEFEASVGDLVRVAAPDLGSTPPEMAIETLHKQLQTARATEARRDELLKRHDAAARKLAHDEENAARAADALSRCAAGLGFAQDNELEPLQARLSERRALVAALRDKRADLALQGEGLDESGLRSECEAAAQSDVEADLARLALEDAELDHDGQQVYADRDRELRRRAALEEGFGAEFAVAQKRAAEVDLHAAARRWMVLKLGALLLGTAIERHRTGQQDPLVRRAGNLFETLTGGAFEGLTQDYDDADNPRLAGRRRGSAKPVPVEGLSEGTRDQLYLALRLAYLEDYASRAEPAPFVADDLFSTFDDERTMHGLGALAAISDHVQPILFTHHRHVADLAQAHLNGDVDIVAL